MTLSPITQPRSPWIWIQFAANPGDKKQYFKTDIRKNDPQRKRRVLSELRRLEYQLMSGGAGATEAKNGWGWVEIYLHGRYSSPDSRETLKVYLKQWRPLQEYLEESEITGPALLERGHAYEYLEWRSSQVKEKSGKLVSHNTARGELKLLGLVMDEACLRKLAAENPIRKLGIKPEDTALKPEITAADEIIIRAALQREHVWMQRAFHVGIFTALRFAECRLEAAQLRWESDDILVEKPKGGRSREFAIPLYPSIRPELETMRRERRRFLYEIPQDVWSPSMEWRRFFDSIDMPHLCFHCTRVTFITRGMRKGIPETIMMKMVNHGSKLISRIYQRWTSDDVRRFAKLLEVEAPAAADATGESPRDK